MKKNLGCLLLIALLFPAYTAYALSIDINGQNYNFSTVHEKSETESIVNLFNRALEKHKEPGKLSQCRDFINLFYRTNNSYGGVCEYTADEESQTVMVCAATMTAQFKMEIIDRYHGGEVNKLSAFVSSSCYGG